MKAVYLAHSGFLVDTGGPVMIFDYYKDTPRGGTLKDGVIDASALKGRDVYVFVSHIHHDHFNPVIFQWEAWAGQIHYILSHDVPMRTGAVRIRPGETRTAGDAQVRALCSKDGGVAFLVKCNGVCVFHAGDLNWWHWNGEPDEENEYYKRTFQEEIGRLEGVSIDVAFMLLDPRQEDKYCWGMNYFLEKIHPRIVFPMHCFGSYKITRHYLRCSDGKRWKDVVYEITRPSEEFVIID